MPLSLEASRPAPPSWTERSIQIKATDRYYSQGTAIEKVALAKPGSIQVLPANMLRAILRGFDASLRLMMWILAIASLFAAASNALPDTREASTRLSQRSDALNAASTLVERAFQAGTSAHLSNFSTVFVAGGANFSESSNSQCSISVVGADSAKIYDFQVPNTGDVVQVQALREVDATRMRNFLSGIWNYLDHQIGQQGLDSPVENPWGYAEHGPPEELNLSVCFKGESGVGLTLRILEVGVAGLYEILVNQGHPALNCFFVRQINPAISLATGRIDISQFQISQNISVVTKQLNSFPTGGISEPQASDDGSTDATYKRRRGRG